MILPIVAYGDPVLKAEAVDIEQGHPGLQDLIRDMWETMYEAEGVGLAAPQVGESIRLFIADATPFAEGEKGDPSCATFRRVMINPVVFETGGAEVGMEEGCLSIPGIREQVVRPSEIKVEYFNEQWELIEEHLTGLAARVVLHEYDHLEGTLITDRVSPARRRLLTGKLRDIGAGRVPAEYRMRFPNGRRK